MLKKNFPDKTWLVILIATLTKGAKEVFNSKNFSYCLRVEARALQQNAICPLFQKRFRNICSAVAKNAIWSSVVRRRKTYQQADPPQSSPGRKSEGGSQVSQIRSGG